MFFITVLRAFAACLITNAHYTGIYPTDIIANGGLIGDVIFFAVSGYCLYNVKMSFFRWYGKRLWRIAVPVWLGTSIILIFGGYDWGIMNWFEWYFYPTYYHFIASIVVLYVPFYFTSLKSANSKKILECAMIVTAVIMVVVYIVFYNKSYYHIDVVREPFIRFLFFESMLLGAYFKQNDEKYQDSFSWRYVLGGVISFVFYFASKLAFSRYDNLSEFQIINQIIIFILLYFIFRVFVGMNSNLEKMPLSIKKAVAFVAGITLEIYIVQYALIEVLRPYFVFPINWFIITFSIVMAAISLHYLSIIIYRCADTLWCRLFKPRNKT